MCDPVKVAAREFLHRWRHAELEWVFLSGRPGEGGAVVWLPPCTLWQLWGNSTECAKKKKSLLNTESWATGSARRIFVPVKIWARVFLDYL